MNHLLLILALILGGCSTAPPVKVKRYTTAVYPPTQHVEVLHTKAPNRDYVELGELSVKANDEEAIEYLVEKAKELGADAILLLGERQQGSIAMPIGQMWMAIPAKRLTAVAIRYQ